MEQTDATPRICMIGGSGRSGTTILKKIFSKHPDAVSIPEYRFSIDPDGLVNYLLSSDSGWSPYHADVRLKRLEALLRDTGKHKKFARAFTFLFNRYSLERFFPRCLLPRYAGIAMERQCPDFFNHVGQLIKDLESFEYTGQWNGSELLSKRRMHYSPRQSRDELATVLGGFWRSVILSTCEHQKKDIFVEDNTWNILWFDRILELLPEAKLVHVIREPRDIISSYTKMRWAPDDPVQAARWYKGIINEWFRVKAGLSDDQYLEIRLEELVAEPESVLKSVADFWNISWNDRLLNVDLSRSHSGRWRKDLSAEAAAAVTSELQSELEILGYSA